MKKILIIGAGAVLLVAGCKTKQIKVLKALEKERVTYNNRFDSLVEISVKNELQWSDAKRSITDNLVLQSIPVLDSSGVRQPFHYKHYVDGVLMEEIQLEGGEITQKKEFKTTNNIGFNNEIKDENTRIEVDVGVKKATESTRESKEKSGKTTGFQFGLYVLIFALVIAFFVLKWLYKKLEYVFPDMEVKKPPDI